MSYYLAIDIGASSGRHILGRLENGKILLEEIYRFENHIVNDGKNLVWDLGHLHSSVIEGLKKCSELGIHPTSVAIDTWGVDYVLLDSDGKEILPAVSYRDSRTDSIPEAVDKIIPRDALYARNGIQPISFNTLYQLYCDKDSGKLDSAVSLLMMPDYLAYKLTGKRANEHTNLTTGALINALSGEIDRELLSTLGIKSSIFGAIYTPGEFLGGFNEETKRLVGFDSKVVICATHDTASAVAACPINKGDMYISSGTWSLIGTELRAPVLTPEAMNSGYTNEGGVEKTYRFLKNIMGMWLLQGIRRELGKKYSYDEMMHMAMDSEPCGYFNPNAKELVAPESMIGAIRLLLNKPEATLGELLASVYHSLAISYREAMLAQESISGMKTERICIIGGGSKDSYLNALTAHYTKKRVVAGPVEATAIGNLTLQMISDGKFDNISAAREAVKNSFKIEEISL